MTETPGRSQPGDNRLPRASVGRGQLRERPQVLDRRGSDRGWIETALEHRHHPPAAPLLRPFAEALGRRVIAEVVDVRRQDQLDAIVARANDELGGIDWQKGCWMGQELTARTKYRGLLKRRLLPVALRGRGDLPYTCLAGGQRLRQDDGTARRRRGRGFRRVQRPMAA